jgi:3-isopropylmalate/(R)-2-methylmalate dehydratase large subunit
LIAADEITQEYLTGVGVSPDLLQDLQWWQTDDEAQVLTHHFDASTLSPQVAAPHSPANTKDVGEHVGQRIDVAYIGACTGAKLEDLRSAAQVLKGKKISSDVKLMVAPASLRDQQVAQSEGVMQALIDAGAVVLPNSCGACAGYGATFDEGQTVISSSARNFKARMGPASVQVYLGSPSTVAASALRGVISDVREVLS